MSNLNNVLSVKKEETYDSLRPIINGWSVQLKNNETGEEPTVKQFKEMREDIIDKIKFWTDDGYYHSIELTEMFIYNENGDEISFSGWAFLNKEDGETSDVSKYLVNVSAEQEKSFLIEIEFKHVCDQNTDEEDAKETLSCIYLDEENEAKINDCLDNNILLDSFKFDFEDLEIICDWRVVSDLGFQ